MSQLRSGRLLGGLNSNARVLATADFSAPLRTSLVPTRGTGAPSFTRATTGTVVDHEGVMRTCLPGEARFTGARLVRNLLTYTTTPVTQSVATPSGMGVVSVSGTGSCFITGASAGVILPSGPVYTNTVKRAWLCDATAETVTGSEMVTNGTFATDASGWTVRVGTLASSASAGLMTNNAAMSAYADQILTTVVGKTYVVSGTITLGTSANPRIGIANTINSHALAYYQATASGPFRITFTATATSTYLTLLQNDNTTGATTTFDNISCRLAEPDRSVNSKPIPIYGSLTKTLVGGVATYSGFSASNYLEEAYSADWGAIGTGDFCIMGWAIPDPSGTDYMMEIGPVGDTSTARIECFTTGNVPYFYVKGASGALSINSTNSVPAGMPFFYVAGVRGGSSFLSVNAGTETSAAAVGSLSNAAAVLRIGRRAVVSGSEFGGSIALWRLSATAPSAEQIAQIYRDELVLFQTPTGSRKQVTIPLGAGATTLTFSGSNSNAQLEDVTGQSVQTAGEYVSAGVLSFPYHGSGVDGVKCFDTTLAGVPIPSATLKGYLSEPARTNLLTYSEDVSNASWTKVNSSVSAGKLVEGAVTNAHGVSQNSISVTSGSVYSGYVSLKAGERTWAYVTFGGAGMGAAGAYIDLSTGALGTVESGVTASVKIEDGGYYKINVSRVAVATSAGGIGVFIATSDNVYSYTGDGASGLYVRRLQFEAGPYASSYIPTTTAAVTRNADVLAYPSVGNISDTAGTSYVAFSAQGITGSNQQILARDTNGLFPYINSFTDRTQLYDGTTQNNATAGPSFVNSTQKSAQSWGAGTKSISYAGTAIASSAYDGTQGTGAIAIGCNNTGTEHLGGNVSDVCIWTRTLPNAVLKRISK